MFKKTDHWTDINNQAGLLFFAQIIDEALFDYSLETYKPRALNLRILCIESLRTIDAIKQGLIKKPNLPHILDELVLNLRTDYAIKTIIGPEIESVIKLIKKHSHNLIELRSIILHIYRYLNDKKYLEYLQDYLRELVPENIQKEHIYSLTRTFLTELINYGYFPAYIYHQSNRHFFEPSTPVTETNPSIFFEKYDFKLHKYTVIFKVNKVFNNFKLVSNQIQFRATEIVKLTNLKGEAFKFINQKRISDTFLIFESVEATDESVARYISAKKIQQIANLFSFYHHDKKPYISQKAVIIDEQTQRSIVLQEQIKSIIKKEDNDPRKAVNEVEQIFKNLELSEKAIIKVSKAIDIHSIALSTDEIENQLLNLWTAIETLIPKNIDSGQDRIIQIIQTLVPFQTVYYVKSLLHQLASDIKYYDKNNSNELSKTIVSKEQESIWNKYYALITTQENEAIRDQFYSKLDKFPLLRWRLFELNRNFLSGKTVKKLIENHIQNVEWQIRRIYRVRNLIVHSGSAPSYTNILTENVHNYFDNFLNYILNVASTEKNMNSIKGGIVVCTISLNEIMRKLDSIGPKPITLDDVKKLISTSF
jgi:hypothetical protein